jgi:Glycosyltransferase family 28 C-terminal domain
VARNTIFCGYLKRPTAAPTREGGPPRVLVTTGGGGDGGQMIETYLEGLAMLPRNVAIETTVIFGPQMPDHRRNSLLERFDYMADATFLDFEPELTRRYAEADVVVSMAGYNTVCELLSFARRAILVPRAEPVMEQLIRARLLAARGLFDLVEPQDLTPETLMGKVLASFKPAPLAAASPDLDGLPRIRERVGAAQRRSKMSGGQIVVVTSGFPRRSETFALGEMLALEERGALAVIFATKPGDGSALQPGCERLSDRLIILPEAKPAAQAEFLVNALDARAVSGIHGYFAHQPAAVAQLSAERLGVPSPLSVNAATTPRSISCKAVSRRSSCPLPMG